MTRIIKFITLSSVLLLAIFTLTACSKGRVVSYSKPDIKDDFCGVSMDYRYCKCAFHNEFCDEIGLSSSAANSYVRDSFNDYVDSEMEAFGQQCKSAGGIYNGNTKCTYCDAPYVKQGDKCVKADEADDSEEGSEEMQVVSIPDGPFNQDCSINEEQFENDWKKYSDFDDSIVFNSRSWEVQQNLNLYERILDLKAQNFILQRDMEIDRQMRLAMREYKAALVQNIKTNLLKSFWRLSYVTYTTIKSAKGLGESYSNVLTSAETLPAISNGLKVVQGVIPGDSSLAIDTKTVSGKVKSAGLNAALEAFDSMGDPVKIATQVFNDASNAALPSADITPEEVEILRTQHLTNQALDQALEASYKANAERRKQLLENQRQITLLEAEAVSWEAKEKARVKAMLETSCLNQQKDNNQQGLWMDKFINIAYAQELSSQQYSLGEHMIDYDRTENDKYYLADSLVLSVYDTDNDGKVDMWLQYDEDMYVVLEAYDTSGDGVADTFVELDKDEVVTNLVEPELVVPQYDIPDYTVNNANTYEDSDSDESSENQRSKWFILIIIVFIGLYYGKKKFVKKKRSE